MAQPFRPDVSPSILTWARESSHVKIDDLASACAVEVSEVENWEAGISGPTFDQLRHIASRTRRSLTTFFLPAPPTEAAVPKQFRTLGSRPVTKLSTTTLVAIRSAQDTQEQARELLAAVGRRSPVVLPQFSQTTGVQHASGLVRAALNISLATQYEWDSEGEAYRSWRAAIESLRVVTLQSSFPLDDGRAFCLADDLAPIIGINSNDSLTGRVFSLLHELIHLCLGVSGLSPLMPLSGRADKHDRDLELFCNRVAAQVLLPVSNDPIKLALGRCFTDGFINERAVADVAASYKVSRAVVVRSLATIRAITPAQAYRYERSTTRPAHRKRGGGAFPPFQICVIRKGLRLPALIMEAYDQDRITMADASGLLGLKVRWFEDLREQLEA
jgi:Zn-dependent peptidase ImmA (M78 family)